MRDVTANAFVYEKPLLGKENDVTDEDVKNVLDIDHF